MWNSSGQFQDEMRILIYSREDQKYALKLREGNNLKL